MNAAEIRFTLLYNAHYRAILGYLLRRLDSVATAQDLTEDVFLIAWRKLDEVPEGDEGGYWLYGVARPVLANHLRTSARRVGLLGFRTPRPPPAQPDEQVVRSEEARTVMAAVTRLRKQDRELIRLAYWDELPHAVIGDLLGCSRNAVDVRLHRALRRLKKAMTRSGHFQVEELGMRAPEETPS